MTRRIFTVGHSLHPIDAFLALLAQHGIDVVADVRSQPWSRRAPQFGRKRLEPSLRAADVRYVFLGEELGGRPPEPEFYDAESHVDYGRVAASERFLRGIERVEEGLARGLRVALLCAEEDPKDCHRRLLVGRVLADRGAEVVHVRGDGRIEIDAQPTQPGLFGGAPEKPWRSKRPVPPPRSKS